MGIIVTLLAMLLAIVFMMLFGFLAEVTKGIKGKIRKIHILFKILASLSIAIGFFVVPLLTSMKISAGDVIAPIGNVFSNFFSSGPFDPELRLLWVIGILMTIAVIILLKRRKER